MNNDVFYEFLDAEIDSDIPIQHKLCELGLTMQEASKRADAYRKKFFSLLEKYQIPHTNISAMILKVTKQLEQIQNEDMEFLSMALVTERGLLLKNYTDEEQKIAQWVAQSQQAENLLQMICSDRKYRQKLANVAELLKGSEYVDIDLEEQALLYQMALQHDFLNKGNGNNIFLENIGELIRKVNGNPFLKEIKPYVYSAVLSRKHKLITERRNYSPNFSGIFNVMEYQISKNNGRNFDTYQSYLELYEQLRRHYAEEADIGLSDYCFANLSNLSEWYYENCVPNELIPMTLKRAISRSAECIDLADMLYIDRNHPVLEIAYQNVLADETRWQDFVKAMQNGDPIQPYCQRLYEEANAVKLCSDKELAMQYAELYLIWFMEEYNRKLLIDAVNVLL